MITSSTRYATSMTRTNVTLLRMLKENKVVITCYCPCAKIWCVWCNAIVCGLFHNSRLHHSGSDFTTAVDPDCCTVDPDWQFFETVPEPTILD